MLTTIAFTKSGKRIEENWAVLTIEELRKMFGAYMGWMYTRVTIVTNDYLGFSHIVTELQAAA